MRRPATTARQGIVSRWPNVAPVTGPRRRRSCAAFHAAHPGITSRALARGGSYDRLAARGRRPARACSTSACGDGYLCALLAAGARDRRRLLARGAARLRARHAGAVGRAGRAQALPFADRRVRRRVSHLAFMLFDDAPAVVARARCACSRPGASVRSPCSAAGRPPTATTRSTRFLALAGPRRRGPRFGDPRARSRGAAGASCSPAGASSRSSAGSSISAAAFDEVWRVPRRELRAVAEDAGAVRAALAPRFAPGCPTSGQGAVPVVTWLGAARRATR